MASKPSSVYPVAARRAIDSGTRLASGNAAPQMSISSTVAIEVGVHSAGRSRSEEHTSELQSLRHLVCRLLLEKKKKNKKISCKLSIESPASQQSRTQYTM